MAEVIHIAGAKGGVGATTCALGLGAALSAAGERTLVIDCDVQCASGLESCGLQGLSVYTLADAEEGACRVKQAVLQHPSFPNLYVLPSLDLKNMSFIDRAIEECEPLFDYVLCDGAGKGACRRAILVCDPYPCSVTAARKRGALLKDEGFKDVQLIVNKVNGGMVFDGTVLTPQELSSVVRVPLCGVIPEDLCLPAGKTLPRTQKAFAATAEFISGKSKKIFGVVKPYSGLKGIIKRKLRERI